MTQQKLWKPYKSNAELTTSLKKKIPVWSTCEPMSHKPASVYNSFQVAVEKAAVYILPAELVMFKQH